jgi:FGGY-family pentulose kinase
MNSNNSYFIGVDFGTQGVRCGIIDAKGEVVVSYESGYSTKFPQPGWATQNPIEWLESLDKAISDCVKKASKDVLSNVKGICLCTTAATVLPVDKDGNALDEAILWMDNRAKDEAEFINKTNHQVLKHCGGEVSVEWFVPKALWLKRNRPEIYTSAYRIVELLDFINFHLTGEWHASICQATCKANYLKDYGKWVNQYYEMIGLEDYESKFNMDIVKLGESVGFLREKWVRKYSLPENLSVYQGGIDAYAAMLGLGIHKAGEMCLVMGTSFVHLVFADKMMFTDGLWGPYKDAVIPGLFLIEGGQVSTGSVTNWFLREFGITGKDGYMEMSERADKIDPGSDGVITLDYFQGNRTPYKDPRAKGVIYGLTLNHTKDHIFRSILEGIAFGTKNIIDTMEKGNLTITNIVASGGVTKNPYWLKIIADVTKTHILLTKNSSNAGILGCAILCAIGSGVYSDFETAIENMVIVTNTIAPDLNEYSKYEASYNNYLEIYQQLKSVMKK